MFEENEQKIKRKVLKKITKVRLKNIALYYLQRFETTTYNLQKVLLKRINDYAFQNKEFDKAEAYVWVDEIVSDFERYGYVDNRRFAEFKIRDYIAAGKSMRYIHGKLAEKGVPEEVIEELCAEQEYDEKESALKLAKKKRIGRFREKSKQAEYRQKDMAALARAGFSYEVVKEVCDSEDD